MKCLLLGALLVACEHPTKPIGENDTDASTLLGSDGDTSLNCSCDASSCGSRVCGRSACGYPCGTCGQDEICLLGTSCNPVTGTYTNCVDAFGDSVSPLDVGFRTCPTDPSKQQSCQCDGNGVWINCDTACIEICTTPPTPVNANITCGSSMCSGGDVCCISEANLDNRACANGSCPANAYTRACDGPEDCATGSVCCGGNELSWTAKCATSCDATERSCHTGNDCPTSAPHCCPRLLQDDMRSCSATDAADCT
jgi:hypothetical protein